MADHKFMTMPTDDSIVYVRKVERDSLPDEVKVQTAGMDAIYSIHDGSGRVLALVDDRKKAFSVARMNEMTPVSVH
ncbi:DUF1150 family protein [Oceanibium sediminis]|uniref:DUF1150 family protein n=1 Tax=Oceanibium sediminis TaxID=2026339 RepID=UPI000DD2D3BF|nr:DUF1150 family protein [Oceanibium sediminis]